MTASPCAPNPRRAKNPTSWEAWVDKHFLIKSQLLGYKLAPCLRLHDGEEAPRVPVVQASPTMSFREASEERGGTPVEKNGDLLLVHANAAVQAERAARKEAEGRDKRKREQSEAGPSSSATEETEDAVVKDEEEDVLSSLAESIEESAATAKVRSARKRAGQRLTRMENELTALLDGVKPNQTQGPIQRSVHKLLAVAYAEAVKLDPAICPPYNAPDFPASQPRAGDPHSRGYPLQIRAKVLVEAWEASIKKKAAAAHEPTPPPAAPRSGGRGAAAISESATRLRELEQVQKADHARIEASLAQKDKELEQLRKQKETETEQQKKAMEKEQKDKEDLRQQLAAQQAAEETRKAVEQARSDMKAKHASEMQDQTTKLESARQAQREQDLEEAKIQGLASGVLAAQGDSAAADQIAVGGLSGFQAMARMAASRQAAGPGQPQPAEDRRIVPHQPEPDMNEDRKEQKKRRRRRSDSDSDSDSDSESERRRRKEKKRKEGKKEEKKKRKKESE